MKQTASVSALFILVNSISGLIGLFSKGQTIDSVVYGWIIIAFIGGLIGSYYGSKKFNNTLLKKILAFTLLIASVKLITIAK